MSGDCLRIGVSACLPGESARFDAEHKRDPFLVEVFGRGVEWVPVCPEVEEQLARERLSGFALKKDPPSCTDPRLRENFIERVFAYRRLRDLFDARWSMGDLVAFHTAHKLTLMAHSPAAYRELGRLVAQGTASPALSEEYETVFMHALAIVATPARHANVLQHMLGYFKKSLDQDARAELAAIIDDHRLGLVPLIVPITLMRHHVRRQKIAYLEGQTYLAPHPRELSLRNHV